MDNAHALRPVRADYKRDRFVFYEGTMAKDSDRATWCKGWLNRLSVLGMLRDDGSGLTLDVLDENGDVIDEHRLTREGFKWLRGRWHFKVDKSMEGGEA
jgi:hypothetical protein